MIGPDGLLLVVSHLIAVLALVLLVGLEKCKEPKLQCGGSHAEHSWSSLQNWKRTPNALPCQQSHVILGPTL